MSPQKRIPGVSYAVSPEGLELPVIDVTHPAFELRLSDEELSSRVAEAIRELDRRERAPAFMRRLFLRFFLRDSILARGIAGSRGSYMGGMSTYLLKLGPDNLDESYAKQIDRKIAASLPCLSARLRLQATAELIAEELAGALAAAPGRALHLVNIAGGPAADSLNALIILRKRRPALFEGRRVVVQVLDRDDRGPAFGSRALAALRQTGSPLHGVDAEFRYLPYDWSEPSALARLLSTIDRTEALVAGSSEGGLFEYGSDAQIVEALRDFRAATASEASFTGSLSRTDGYASCFNAAGGAAIRFRSPEAFAKLVRQAGWTIARTVECPLSLVVCLKKSGYDRRPKRSMRAKT